MKKKLTWILLVFLLNPGLLPAQTLFQVQGNGLFSTASSTNVDLKNTDDNTNTLLRFGDNNTIKSSLGFDGTDDVFKISMGTTLGSNHLTISESGLLGINSLPSVHRMLINHNSTSGTAGSAHLTLRENNTADFARLRFENFGDDGLWTIASRATEGTALMNFFHHDGTNFANVLSLDGENFYVGILTTAPEGYLHIRQQTAGVQALLLENDAASGGEKWAFQVGTDDLDVYLDNVLVGSFDAVTGAYTNFPPAPALSNPTKFKDQVLSQVMKLDPLTYSLEKGTRKAIGLNPLQVEKLNPDWVVRSEDGEKVGINYQQFAVLAIKSIQEQQEIYDAQAKEIADLEAEETILADRLAQIEAQIARLIAAQAERK